MSERGVLCEEDADNEQGRWTYLPLDNGAISLREEITYEPDESFTLPPAALPALRRLLEVDAATVLYRIAEEIQSKAKQEEKLYESYLLESSDGDGSICAENRRLAYAWSAALLRTEAEKLRGDK